MRRLVACAFLVLLAVSSPALAQSSACPGDGENYPAMYLDETLFARAIARADANPALTGAPTGVTVPHHLLAGHLIAGGVRLAADGRYDRIIVLLPDHFRQARKPFATTTSGFDTVYGPVGTDADGARRLLAATGLAAESCLFGREHGIHALTPFLRHYLPDVPVLPVAISIHSTPTEWEELVAALAPLAGERTLVLQSTDFSHYLPHHEARLRDQQTLNVLAAGDLDALTALSQPDHMDSVGAMYVQMALQKRLRGAIPMVLASENSQQYVDSFVAETTSYMVIAFAADATGPGYAPLTDAHRYVLAGDTFFGRAMTRVLLDEDAAERVADAIDEATGSLPLIVNIEGVLLPDVPEAIDHMELAMPRDLAVGWLRRLNVRAVGLANNHAMDLGPSGFAETRAALDTEGIDWAAQGDALELPGLTLVALSDHGTNASQEMRLLGPALLDRLMRQDAEIPVIAYVHWGREYATEPSGRERELAEEMRRRGVAAIVGAHSHMASPRIVQIGGGDVALIHSLGNFVFDQGADRSSGALAHVTAFGQGTIFLRQAPLPNLFDLARRQHSAPKAGSR